jgi:predicted transcriptional regulator
MTKHRDRIGIIADLLKATGKGARKTRIMYIANLSHCLLRKYLGLAVSLGYLTLERLRSHGSAFLKKYSEYSSRYSNVGKELESIKLEKEELTRMCTSDRTLESKAIERNQRVPATHSDS